MKFVFLGYDMMLPVAQQLIHHGHTLAGIMSFPCDQIFNFSHNARGLSVQTGAPLIESPINEAHIQDFIKNGTKAFIAAGYPYKIPPINEDDAYGINIHPSNLPHARGIMPVPHIITNDLNEAAGFTIHKLAAKFDTGDILGQQNITLDDDETVERYCAKILTRAPHMMQDIMDDIETYWDSATKQDETKASSYSAPSEEMRTLNWSQDIDDILKTANAFGRYGCVGHFDNRAWHIFASSGWREGHEHSYGTCITLQNNLCVIAVKNGYIVVKEFQLITN